MASRFSVSVARRCEFRVRGLRGEVKKKFDSVVDELRQRGCEAGDVVDRDYGEFYQLPLDPSPDHGRLLKSVGTGCGP
jgi:hypothetical protein